MTRRVYVDACALVSDCKLNQRAGMLGLFSNARQLSNSVASTEADCPVVSGVTGISSCSFGSFYFALPVVSDVYSIS